MERAPRRLPARWLTGLALLVGSLDLLSAFVDYYLATGKGPAGVLRYIAAGLLGPDAARSGAGPIALGVTIHYFFALLFTFLLYVLYRPLRLYRWPVLLLALLYGLLVWLLMNRLFVPLSALPQRAFRWDKALKAWLILVFMIGLPLALLLGRRPVQDRAAA
ncbi:hypothetical protein [Flaviaesturariibacter terrae]